MSWKATLDAAQVKQFKSGLACLGRIGTELLIEAVPSKLIVRSLNSSLSAFASITYHSNFFDSHAIFNSRDVKGSVLVKHALALFRTQKIQTLKLQLDVSSTEQLIAIVMSENGLQKEYKIPCIQSEILQATVDRDTLPTCVIATASELSKLLSSFQNNLEEITIIALPEGMHNGESRNAVQIHSYQDSSKRHLDASLHTHVSVNTDLVFTGYQHTADTPADVTFNLRDFRVMLAWCLAMNMEIAIRFQSPGAPLLVEPHCPHADQDVEAQLILATLLESQAWRVTGRNRQPGTAGATAQRTRFQTPGFGRTPYIPGDTPAAGRTGNGGAAGPSRVNDGEGPRRSRFAPQEQRQPQFDASPPRGDANHNAGLLSARHAPGDQVGGDDGGVGHVENEDAQESSQQHRAFGSMGNGLPPLEGFDDDDLEDRGAPEFRSRYDPTRLGTDDLDNASDAIPGTP